ncbi:oligogalacturonate lyase family protein [Rhizomicrobium electricum]|uniref:Oligogalacturonate lyase domain-containing protein n=1 Tax=Rhizomicrobium electricum TaxID=480070 RepID=A0ABN1EDE1_9PROT|nr:oligogalacturonide lyase [Rhizomicrobium electricum]
MQLSDEPGSLSLYFNVNGYTPDGTTLVISTPTGIATVNLTNRKLTKIATGHLHLLFVGRKTGTIYYENATGNSAAAKAIYAVPAAGGPPRLVARIPSGTIQTINADETRMAGVEEYAPPAKVSGDGLMRDGKHAQTKGEMMKARLEANIPMRIFVLDLTTGKRRTLVQSSSDWLNHLQFSPSDPNLLLFCHEGDWHRVDRIWLIRTDEDGAKPLKVHSRTMAMEIAGHEWFSADGNWVWYDLQTPRGQVFWVAGYEIATGRRLWYNLARDEWSVHYNTSRDGALFSGDGGGPGMVAHASDGKWIYLFRPQEMPDEKTGDHATPPGLPLIHTGVFEAEKLVDLKTHNYHLEPNASFTPDGKWLVFRSNMHGASQVYAVEIAKAK